MNYLGFSIFFLVSPNRIAAPCSNKGSPQLNPSPLNRGMTNTSPFYTKYFFQGSGHLLVAVSISKSTKSVKCLTTFIRLTPEQRLLSLPINSRSPWQGESFYYDFIGMIIDDLTIDNRDLHFDFRNFFGWHFKEISLQDDDIG